MTTLGLAVVEWLMLCVYQGPHFSAGAYGTEFDVLVQRPRSTYRQAGIMTRDGQPIPAIIYLAALQAGQTPAQAYATAYPTPTLHTNKGPQ